MMAVCCYGYCRAPFDDGERVCPRCGHPQDDRLIQDPTFVMSARVDGLPAQLMDMHQILPAFDGIERLQLAAMERFGITKALLQSVPPQATRLLGNEPLLNLARQHSDRFWASQFIDPRMPEAVAAVERIADSGARVVKLLSTAGYRPDDPAFDPVWETMQSRGLVAMAHTGFITARYKKDEARAGAFMSSRFANPLYWDMPARKFPNLTVILCHLGGALWYEEGAQMVTQHDNVWGDVSGFGIFALARLLRVRSAIDWTKVFWGNDAPAFCYPLSLRLHMAALRDAGAEALAPGLLHDHGQRFAEQFLGA